MMKYYTFLLLAFLLVTSCSNKKKEENKDEYADTAIEAVNMEEEEEEDIYNDFFYNFTSYKYYGANKNPNPEYNKAIIIKEFVPDDRIYLENINVEEALKNDSNFLKKGIAHINYDSISSAYSYYPNPILVPYRYNMYLTADSVGKQMEDCFEPPFGDRFFRKSQDINNTQYMQIVNYLSRNRYSVDFLFLYNSFSSLIIKTIDDDNYEKNLRPRINALLYSFDRLNESPLMIDSLYTAIYITNSESDKYKFYGRYGNEEDDQEMEMFKDVNSFHTLSFWIRRLNEGNLENVYRTLSNFKQDMDHKISEKEKGEYREREAYKESEEYQERYGHYEEDETPQTWNYLHCITDPSVCDIERYSSDIAAAIESEPFSHYFYFYYNDWPEYYKYVDDEENQAENRIVTMDVEDRSIPIEQAYSKAYGIYVSIVNEISKNRFSYNFQELYRANKKIIQMGLSKKVYNRNYRKQVNKLLDAYNTYNQLSYPEKIMLRECFLEMEPKYITTFHGYESDDKDVNDVINRLLKNYNYKSDNPEREVFYTISFWSRRDAEKNIRDVYNTLKEIQEDYE